MQSENYSSLTSLLWNLLNGDQTLLKNIKCTGPEQVLPSIFDVTALASVSVGMANLSAAELKTTRSHSANLSPIEINTIDACAAFKGDTLFQPKGWELPSVWDAFAGDYQCADHWIRLHTNYSYHREAAFKVLGIAADKKELAEKILKWKAADLEQAIVDANGCAAVMYSQEAWSHHTQGIATANETAVKMNVTKRGSAAYGKISATDLPLKDIRVLDMTRVIAGPVCTKFLSAHGAQVLRIDPPNFQEVAALLPETTVGKKRTFLDITSSEDRKKFEQLIKEAHVFVHGLRPDALKKLGITDEYLAALNPNLIVASLNAYGSQGPWKNRRGFDSLVQMSSGIASAGAVYKKSDKPIPMPVQALDHSVGFLLAAGVCRSLTELYKNGEVNIITGSLVGASNTLQKYAGDFDMKAPENSFFTETLIEENTFWGSALRVRCPGRIDGQHANWGIKAGPLGIDPAAF